MHEWCMKFWKEVFRIFPGGLESLNDEVFFIFVGRPLGLKNMDEQFNLNMMAAKNPLVSSLSEGFIYKREVI